MEFTYEAFSELVQTVGGTGLTALSFAAIFIAWKFGPAWMKIQKEKVVAQEDENKLRRFQIKVLLNLCRFLKEKGHDIEVPDLTEEF